MLKSKCEILSNIQTMCVRGGEGAKRVLRAADISAFSNVQVVIVNHKLSSGDLLISLYRYYVSFVNFFQPRFRSGTWSNLETPREK